MKIRKRTIFDTPMIRFTLHWISLFILKIFGWEVIKPSEKINRCVMIAAPHTSNWDFVLTLLMAFALDLKAYTMGKKELFDWPFGGLFSWLGVIPIDRSRSNNVVAQAVDFFKQSENLILVVPPSGTRAKVKRWKTGFYHIAKGAEVPIGMGFLDYGQRKGGIGFLFEPTGDIDEDMIAIRAFYADIKGKYPEDMIEYVPVNAG